jgi:Caspase domain
MNAASEAKTRAVIIGVSRYPSGISQLPAVESDVREMKKILESEASAFGGNEVSVLTEETASCREIIDTLQRVLSGAEPSQSTFVYLAGHGTIASDNEYYYVPFDADPKSISETCVPLKRIKELFEFSPSERLFLWLDFCHSGGILARGFGGERQPDAESTIERTLNVLQGMGKVIMCACSADQRAYEDKSHGRFTRYLIDGLKGDASNSQGEVTANSLHDYVDFKMGSLQQRPLFFGSLTGRIVLMRSRITLLDNEPQPANENVSGQKNKRLDFSDALVSPQAAYERAIEIIGDGDKLAWGRLLNSAAQKAAAALSEWRQRPGLPPDNSVVLKHALAGANTACEFIACLVAAAETKEESYSSDLGWIHTIRTPANWPVSGYSYFVDFPLVILFIAQAVIGGALMEHGGGETALRIALSKIPQRYDNNPRALFEATSVNGWPKALNGDSSIAWNLLNSVLEQWEWLKTGLAPNRTPQNGIIAYYLLLHFLRFARLAKNGIAGDNPLIIPEIFSAPLWFLQWRTEENNLGYWLLLKQATLLNRILDQQHIDKEIFNREWPTWMKHVLQWFRPGSIFVQPAFASLPQDLDVGNWSG